MEAKLIAPGKKENVVFEDEDVLPGSIRKRVYAPPLGRIGATLFMFEDEDQLQTKAR